MHPKRARSFSSRPRTERIGPRSIAAVVVANVALAFGPWMVRLADVGPVAAAFWRIALALPVLLVAAAVMVGNPVRGLGRLWVPLLLGGLAFAGDLASWHVGIVRTTLANATLFGNMASLIYPIYGFVILRAWPSRVQALALLLAAMGAALLLGRSAELSARNLAGDLFCMLAGVLYAVYFITAARARKQLSPVHTLALISLATVLPLLLLAWAKGEVLWPRDWTPLLLLAVLSQIIGQGLMIYALGVLPPLIVGIALLFQPVVSGTIGWIAYGERLTLPDFVGAGLVAVALVLVRRGERRAMPLAPPAPTATSGAAGGR